MGDSGTSPSKPASWKHWRQEKRQLHKQWKEQRLLKKQAKVKKGNDSLETKTVEKETAHTDGGRRNTLSMAVPGSILDNAQSPELRTYLAGQIARAASIFGVDEIVVFDDHGPAGTYSADATTTEGEFTGVGKKGRASIQMARILQYLECPQYLRKHFFPIHQDLQYAGLLNPLEAPHHLRTDDRSPYREGIVLDRPAKEGKGSFVSVGLPKNVQIDKRLLSGIRVTVKLDPNHLDSKKMKGIAVAPSVPHTEGGTYWGYSVRLASSLSSVLTESPFPEGYDLTIGTSDRGDDVDEITIPSFRHAIVVFGGLQGLEASLDADQALDVGDPRHLFSLYLNTCPSQGSRTIRTEEAVLISLSVLRPKMLQAVRPGR